MRAERGTADEELPSPEPSHQKLARQISNSVLHKKRARQEMEEQVDSQNRDREMIAKRARGRSYTQKKSYKTLWFNLAVDSEQTEVGDSDSEQTEDGDSDSGVTTPELARALADLVPYGEPVETLSLVLEDSADEIPADEIPANESQADESPAQLQEKPEGSARGQGSAGDAMEEQAQGIDEGGEEYELLRMFYEEHESNDSFVAILSSSNSSVSEDE